MLPLDSLAYRMLWHLKRFLRLKDCGPRPIQWNEPIRQFLPPPNLVESSLDPKEAGNFRALLRELELLTRLTDRLPSKLSEKDWRKLIRLPNTRHRFEFLCFLHHLESVRARDRLSETEKSAWWRTNKAEVRKEFRQKLFSFPRNLVTMENEMSSRRCVQAFQMADELPRIAIDCRWLHLHSERSMDFAMNEVATLLHMNRKRPQPWPVSLTNFDEKNPLLVEARRRHLTNLDSDSLFSGDLSPKSYLELFPELRAANKIVYLSPHSKQWLESVDAGTCYVIGGLVDRIREPAIPKRASLVTAETEGLPCRKLPLKGVEYRLLQYGKPVFTFDQVLATMQEVFDGADWQTSFDKHIPRRKYLSPEEKAEREQQQPTAAGDNWWKQKRNILRENAAVLRLVYKHIHAK